LERPFKTKMKTERMRQSRRRTIQGSRWANVFGFWISALVYVSLNVEETLQGICCSRIINSCTVYREAINNIDFFQALICTNMSFMKNAQHYFGDKTPGLDLFLGPSRSLIKVEKGPSKDMHQMTAAAATSRGGGAAAGFSDLSLPANGLTTAATTINSCTRA